mmetsp:Transcript_23523/g.72645  ORF Transcript_23523/g.72645 Transcript_23523/m.72645 type:complete len:83 (-) Transcript_23523:268-516(-)
MSLLLCRAVCCRFQLRFLFSARIAALVHRRKQRDEKRRKSELASFASNFDGDVFTRRESERTPIAAWPLAPHGEDTAAGAAR